MKRKKKGDLSIRARRWQERFMQKIGEDGRRVGEKRF